MADERAAIEDNVVSKNLKPPGLWKLQSVALAGVLLSVGGIVVAVYTNTAAHGMRGGVLAVALSFLMLFVGKNTSKMALETDLALVSTIEDPVLRETRSWALGARNALSAMLDWQDEEKLYLTISSVVGTLTAGFGDLIARLLGVTQ